MLGLQDRRRRKLRTIRPTIPRALTALAVIAAVTAPVRTCLGKDGLRWTGEVRGAADGQGLVAAGAALRFRYGLQFRDVSVDGGHDAGSDLLLGSWAGFEGSAGLLSGTTRSPNLGTALLLGTRLWLSRKQTRWFLATERWSLAGLALPEVGLAVGLVPSPTWYLSWDLPVGPQEFQIVGGVVWLSPAASSKLLPTLAFRVPM